MQNILDQIKASAAGLQAGDSLVLDKALGELSYLIHTARSAIDDEWRAARAQPRPLIDSDGLDQILRDIESLKPISEET